MRYRTQWYQEQQQQLQAMMAARSAARRRRPRARIVQTWSHLEGTSVALANLLEDVLATMQSHPMPGQPAAEVTVTLSTYLNEDPPPEVEAPARAKPISPLGRRRIVAGGNVEQYAVLARVEIVARAVVYGLPGEESPDEMSRRTWHLPVKTAEKREVSPENQED